MKPQHAFGRILILEDDQLRVAWFKQKFLDYEQDITCDVLQAIEWLKQNEYALILLDHDLIDEHYYSYNPDDSTTGFFVAAWIAKNKNCQRDAIIIIHSLNYIGAERMLQTLLEAGRDAEHIPFHCLQADL